MVREGLAHSTFHIARKHKLLLWTKQSPAASKLLTVGGPLNFSSCSHKNEAFVWGAYEVWLYY